MSVFNSPFLLGFEQFERTIDRISKLSTDSYPPYNIEQISTNLLRITIAVAGFDKTDSGLYYKIIQKGDGVKPTSGQTVSVHYKGMLPEGTTFDSSYDRGTPIDFPIGMGHVIAGWDEGILLLNKGDKARFVIPSDLGYGAQGAGGVIPPNATLIFDVELMDIKG